MSLEIAEKIKILHKDIDLLKNNIDWDRSNSELKILIKTSETDGFWDEENFINNENIIFLEGNSIDLWENQILDLFENENRFTKLRKNGSNLI